MRTRRIEVPSGDAICACFPARIIGFLPALSRCGRSFRTVARSGTAGQGWPLLPALAVGPPSLPGSLEKAYNSHQSRVSESIGHLLAAEHRMRSLFSLAALTLALSAT